MLLSPASQYNLPKVDLESVHWQRGDSIMMCVLLLYLLYINGPNCNHPNTQFRHGWLIMCILGQLVATLVTNPSTIGDNITDDKVSSLYTQKV